ncbi:MAG: hypothetical protein E4H36_13410 [Spirochaetales bacterium]|nr:MAG: hypothetical protein E4H36_13410 [Spirochaetales bacterium]
MSIILIIIRESKAQNGKTGNIQLAAGVIAYRELDWNLQEEMEIRKSLHLIKRTGKKNRHKRGENFAAFLDAGRWNGYSYGCIISAV